MKKLLFFICIFEMNVVSLYAQNYPVHIEPVGSPTTLFVPAHDVFLGKFDVIVIPTEAYHLDSCWLALQGTIPQVIMNLKFNRSDYPQYNPYESWGSMQSNHFMTLGAIYNFPPVENDTTRIEFTADIGVNVLPPVGSTLLVSLQCLGFSLDHEDIVTNTAFGFPLILEYDPNMSVENPFVLLERPIIVGKLGILEIDTKEETVNVYNSYGQSLWSGKGIISLQLSPGIYICHFGDFYMKKVVF